MADSYHSQWLPLLLKTLQTESPQSPAPDLTESAEAPSVPPHTKRVTKSHPFLCLLSKARVLKGSNVTSDTQPWGLARHRDSTNTKPTSGLQDVAFSFLPMAKTAAAVAKGDRVTQRRRHKIQGGKSTFVWIHPNNFVSLVQKR